ncbi:MAG: hypothetical protein HND48_23850 [Chloroflexi bacterium]|nr:hypothetical protein [Chloroflexota bacterium]
MIGRPVVGFAARAVVVIIVIVAVVTLIVIFGRIDVTVVIVKIIVSAIVQHVVHIVDVIDALNAGGPDFLGGHVRTECHAGRFAHLERRCRHGQTDQRDFHAGDRNAVVVTGGHCAGEDHALEVVLLSGGKRWLADIDAGRLRDAGSRHAELDFDQRRRFERIRILVYFGACDVKRNSADLHARDLQKFNPPDDHAGMVVVWLDVGDRERAAGHIEGDLDPYARLEQAVILDFDAADVEAQAVDDEGAF